LLTLVNIRKKYVICLLSHVSILFTESRLGNMTLKNRFVRSATWKLYDIYEELAQGEVGLIVTGYANIVEEEKPNAGMMGMYNDSFIDEYKKLTDLVHRYDSKIVMQLAYGGTKTTYNVGERVIFAPSAVAEKGTNTLGKAMTQDEIDYIVQALEIHAAHTYLINQFLSPYYNQRTDQYRKLVGNDFPILVKLTATEFFEGGQTFEETRIICKKLEQLGVDGIIVSGNIHGKADTMVGEKHDGYTIEAEGYFHQYGQVISQEVSIPVITVGGLSDFSAIEEIAM